MIITITKDIQNILSNLEKEDKIAIVSCDNCAKVCGTGGEEGAAEMKKVLEKFGYNVTDIFTYGPLCAKDLNENLREINGDTALILGCEAGEYTLKKFTNFKKVILCLDSLGIGAYDESGKPFTIKSF